MSFEIKGDGIDVGKIREDILRSIEEKKESGLVSDEELEALSERGLDPVLRGGELRGTLLEELQERDHQWNYSFDPETLYRSSRGAVGQALEKIRRLLRPVQKLFWNPNPMISALSRQSDLNRYSTHLLHNLVLELTRLNLEVQELRNRNLQLTGRVEMLSRRARTLEDLALAGRDRGETREREGE